MYDDADWFEESEQLLLQITGNKHLEGDGLKVKTEATMGHLQNLISHNIAGQSTWSTPSAGLLYNIPFLGAGYLSLSGHALSFTNHSNPDKRCGGSRRDTAHVIVCQELQKRINVVRRGSSRSNALAPKAVVIFSSNEMLGDRVRWWGMIKTTTFIWSFWSIFCNIHLQWNSFKRPMKTDGVAEENSSVSGSTWGESNDEGLHILIPQLFDVSEKCEVEGKCPPGLRGSNQ